MSLALNSTQVPSGKLFAWVACNKLSTYVSLVIDVWFCYYQNIFIASMHRIWKLAY